MDKVYNGKENCCGCSACENICPKKAIIMTVDEKGFRYPQIDTRKCVKCRLCEEVCPYNCDVTQKNFEQKYYAVQHTDNQVRYNSSSGGFFTALSDQVLVSGGVVYGVSMGESFVIRHERATSKRERDKFIGSKYVQSDMAGVMQALLKDLEQGKNVLFVGTPCQVAGVSSYVRKKHGTSDGLLLCDFICHGASSPIVWKEYVEFLSRKYKSGLVRYQFRGKKQGWHQWYPIIVNEDSDVSEIHRKQESYILLYQTCFINRECCYTCKYTSYDRVSDFTMADFWNIEKVASEMDDNKGTSEVLVNSVKGMEWFEQCKESIRYVECSKEDVWQPHLEYPEAMPAKREVFWKDFAELDFAEVISKYGKGDWVTKLKNFVTPIAKKIGIYVLLGKLYRMIFTGKEKRNEE